MIEYYFHFFFETINLTIMPRTRELRAYLATTLARSSLSATRSGMKSVKPIAQLIMKMDGLVLIKFIIASLVLGLLNLRLPFWALSNFASLITSGFDGVSVLSLSK